MSIFRAKGLFHVCDAIRGSKARATNCKPAYTIEQLETRTLLAAAIIPTAPTQLDTSPTAGAHEAEMVSAIDPTNARHIEAVSYEVLANQAVE